jgi:N-acetylmuramoyl-L-alanine amidase
MKKFLGTALLLLNVFFAFAQPIKESYGREAAQAPGKIRVIFIDPGHGGRDPGASASYLIDGEQVTMREKDISLGIAMALRERLLPAFPGINVVLVRDDDSNIPISERTDRINSTELGINETAIYISIHVGYTISANVRGYWFFVNNGADNSGSIRLAQSLGAEFSRAYEETPFLGVSQNEFSMPNSSHILSVMLQMGNINNREDALLLHGSHALERCAAALAQGITAYIGSQTRLSP